jgi:conjugative transposon TraK protein
MFKKFQDIDDSFKQIRKLSFLAIVAAALTSILAIYFGFSHAAAAQKQIYVLVNGQAFQANASNEQDNTQIEANDDLSQFHELVFNLDPDAKKIETNMQKAFALADASVKKLYDNLRESGYIAGIVSSNISQAIIIDSIRLEPAPYPHLLGFHLFATERLIRASSITTRSLVTDGLLRQVQRSLDNSHGLLVEQFRVIENKDLNTQTK